jgi:hypothetical protein
VPWKDLRKQLGETDAPGTDTPTLRQQQDLGAHSARGPPDLDRYYRFKDLKALGIVGNWPTLLSWIRTRGFPPGKLVSPKIRIWSRAEIQAWLDAQSSEAA